MYARSQGLDFDPAVVDQLITSYYRPKNIELRGCHPRDLIEHSRSLAEYLGRPFEFSLELLRTASDSYFVDDQANHAR